MVNRLFTKIFCSDVLYIKGKKPFRCLTCFFVKQLKSALYTVPYSLPSVLLINNDSDIKRAVFSLISHGLFFSVIFKCRSTPILFLPGNLPGVFSPSGRSCFSQLWRYFAGGHILFRRSFSFQGASVIYEYSLTKKDALSRISKRLEQSTEMRGFPRLWKWR